MQSPRTVSTLKWFSASSGPLVLSERSCAEQWNDQHLTWARQHPEPIASISIEPDGDALILEGGFDTAWWQTPTTGGGILVRMLWADDENAVVRALQNVSAGAWIEDGLTFDAGSGALVLFDGSLDEPAYRPLEIFTAGCTLAVSTANIEPDPHTCLVAHRLSPLH